MSESEIPTPKELMADLNAAHNREVVEIIGRIVERLRKNPTQRVCVTGTFSALSVAMLRMQSRGWVCELYEGSQREPDPTLSVRAPEGAERMT